ncbi:hypothetical protein D3C84_1107200 [compost metagenome]
MGAGLHAGYSPGIQRSLEVGASVAKHAGRTVFATDNASCCEVHTRISGAIGSSNEAERSRGVRRREDFAEAC